MKRALCSVVAKCRLNASSVAAGSQARSEDLVLLCAHPHRLEDGTYERHSQEKDTGQNRGTGPLVVKRPDLSYQRIGEWFIDDNEIPAAFNDFEENHTDNLEELDKELNDTIDRTRDGFNFERQHSRAYPDLLNTNLDGKIAQITYTVDGSGTTTRISLNSEHHFGPKAAQRRRAARQKVIDEVAMPVVNLRRGELDVAIKRGI